MPLILLWFAMVPCVKFKYIVDHFIMRRALARASAVHLHVKKAHKRMVRVFTHIQTMCITISAFLGESSPFVPVLTIKMVDKEFKHWTLLVQ